MEDSGSRASVESCPDDFVIVNENPKLHLEGSTSEMKNDIKNILTSDLEIISVIKNNNLEINNLTVTHKKPEDDNLLKSNDSDLNDDSSFSNLGSEVSSPNNIKEPFDNKTQPIDKTIDEYKSLINNFNHESLGDALITNTHEQAENNLVKTNENNITDKNSPNTSEISTTKTPDIDVQDTSNTNSTITDTKQPTDLVINLPSPSFTKEQYMQDEEAMLFVGVMYLGSTVIHASRSLLLFSLLLSIHIILNNHVVIKIIEHLLMFPIKTLIFKKIIINQTNICGLKTPEVNFYLIHNFIVFLTYIKDQQKR